MEEKTFDSKDSSRLLDTRHNEVVTLGRYLDGLTLSVYGYTHDHVSQELESKQDELWETGKVSPYSLKAPSDSLLSALPEVNLLRIQDYGRDGFKYHLDNEYMNLRVKGLGYLPDLRLKFKAPFLYRLQGYLPDLKDIASEIHDHFLEKVQSIRVSECAFAVDFQVRAGMIPQVEDAVGGSKKWITEGEGSAAPTGLTLGKNSKRIEFQIYDKSVEIEKSKKQWMKKFWFQHQGYSESSATYRAEFRFRREILNDFKKPDEHIPTGINTIEDLDRSLGDLLQYAVGNESQKIKSWLRFCTPESRETSNGRKSRSSYRPTAPWWKVVAAEFVNGTTPSGRVRMSPGSGYSPEHTRKMLYSYIVKLAAERWIANPECFPFIEDYIGEAYKHAFYSVLETKGTTWAEEVQAKAYELRQKGCIVEERVEKAA